MQILPVLDLKGGVVVRGVAGRREEYRPVASRLCGDPAPESVAGAFVRELGLPVGYLADLDALAGAEPNWDAYRRILAAGLSLWVDAGVADGSRAARLANWNDSGRRLDGVIAGLETLAGPTGLGEALAAIGAERLVFSLDLRGGKPLTSHVAWREAEPAAIAAEAAKLGVRKLLVLDIAQVGVGQGVGTVELCRTIRRQSPEMFLIAGGGVRSLADLKELAAAGCGAVLVASALHDGTIGRGEIRECGMMNAE